MNIHPRTFAAVVVLVACTVAAYGQGAAGVAAKLVEDKHDHGSVFVGTPVKGSFLVENTGTVPFTIKEAKTSCHCTTAVVNTGSIAPGARGEVSYEMEGKSPGRRSISMRVITEPPLTEAPVFTAIATFDPFIQVDSKLLEVEVPQGKAASVRIPLTFAKGAEKLELLGVTTRARDVNVSLERAPDGATHELVVNTPAPLPPGKRVARCSVEYDLHGKAVQEFLVTINTLPLVKIEPNPVVVKFDAGKNEATMNVTLTHVKGETFKLKAVMGQLIDIKPVAAPAESAVELTVPITFVRTPEKRVSRGFIVFQFEGELGEQKISAVLPRDLAATRSTPQR